MTGVRILVTGGAGFIGSQVTDLLTTSGWDVVGLADLLHQAHGSDEVPGHSTGHQFVQGSVTAGTSCASCCPK